MIAKGCRAQGALLPRHFPVGAHPVRDATSRRAAHSRINPTQLLCRQRHKASVHRLFLGASTWAVENMAVFAKGDRAQGALLQRHFPVGAHLVRDTISGCAAHSRINPTQPLCRQQHRSSIHRLFLCASTSAVENMAVFAEGYRARDSLLQGPALWEKALEVTANPF